MVNYGDKAIPHIELNIVITAIKQYADIRPQEEKEKYNILVDKLLNQKTLLDCGQVYAGIDVDTCIFTKSEMDNIVLAFKVYVLAAENVEWSDRIEGIKVKVSESNEAASNLIKDDLKKRMDQINQLEQE